MTAPALAYGFTRLGDGDDICNICDLNRTVVLNEGVRLCGLERTPEVGSEITLLLDLLRCCANNCGAAGGWN